MVRCSNSCVIGRGFKMKKTQSKRGGYPGSNQLSFLKDTDSIVPKLPQKNTLAERALILLLKEKQISHLDFQDVTNSYRLAAHIHVLRQLGWQIMSQEEKCYVTAKPNFRTYSRYFLSPEDIKRFKKYLRGCV